MEYLAIAYLDKDFHCNFESHIPMNHQLYSLLLQIVGLDYHMSEFYFGTLHRKWLDTFAIHSNLPSLHLLKKILII